MHNKYQGNQQYKIHYFCFSLSRIFEEKKVPNQIFLTNGEKNFGKLGQSLVIQKEKAS
jgi:hypothetical protein